MICFSSNRSSNTIRFLFCELSSLGSGTSSADSFTNELAEELYKPVTRKYQRRRVNVNSIDEIWAADLIDMQTFSKDNNGIKNIC